MRLDRRAEPRGPRRGGRAVRTTEVGVAHERCKRPCLTRIDVVPRAATGAGLGVR